MKTIQSKVNIQLSEGAAIDPKEVFDINLNVLKKGKPHTIKLPIHIKYDTDEKIEAYLKDTLKRLNVEMKYVGFDRINESQLLEGFGADEQPQNVALFQESEQDYALGRSVEIFFGENSQVFLMSNDVSASDFVESMSELLDLEVSNYVESGYATNIGGVFVSESYKPDLVLKALQLLAEVEVGTLLDIGHANMTFKVTRIGKGMLHGVFVEQEKMGRKTSPTIPFTNLLNPNYAHKYSIIKK